MMTADPLRSDRDYRDALLRLAALLSPLATHEEAAHVESVAAAIEEYERFVGVHHRSPIDAIRARMSQLRLSVEDMTPFLGSVATARKVLAGTQPLGITMIGCLISRLGIPADNLVHKTRPIGDAR